MNKYEKATYYHLLDGKIKSLKQYIRNKNGHRVGVLFAFKYSSIDTCFEIGWSQCKKGDKFDAQRGVEMAAGRACTCNRHVSLMTGELPDCLPYSLDPEVFKSFLWMCYERWPESLAYAYNIRCS